MLSKKKKGRTGEGPQHLLTAVGDRIDRYEWPQVWDSLGSEWPVKAATPYPLAHNGTEAWVQTARLEPDLLLHHVRRFIFPG